MVSNIFFASSTKKNGAAEGRKHSKNYIPEYVIHDCTITHKVNNISGGKVKIHLKGLPEL